MNIKKIYFTSSIHQIFFFTKNKKIVYGSLIMSIALGEGRFPTVDKFIRNLMRTNNDKGGGAKMAA